MNEKVNDVTAQNGRISPMFVLCVEDSACTSRKRCVRLLARETRSGFYQFRAPTIDIQALLKSFVKEADWELPEMESVPFAGNWKGREGIKQFFEKVSKCKTSFRLSRRNLSRNATT